MQSALRNVKDFAVIDADYIDKIFRKSRVMPTLAVMVFNDGEHVIEVWLPNGGNVGGYYKSIMSALNAELTHENITYGDYMAMCVGDSITESVVLTVESALDCCDEFFGDFSGDELTPDFDDFINNCWEDYNG